MANKLNDFDLLIKETYENHPFEYSPSNWEELSAELESTAPSFSAIIGSIGVGVTLTAIVFVSLFFYNENKTGGLYTTEEEIVEFSGRAEANTYNDKTGNEDEQIVPFDNEDNFRQDNAVIEDKQENAAKDPTAKNFNPEQKETVKALMAEAKILLSEEKTFEDKVDENSSIVRGCAGLTINFESPSDYGEKARYLWNFGDGNFSNEENPTHAFHKEGIFDVSLSVTGLGSGQISSDVVQAMIEVYETPSANFGLAVGSKDAIYLLDHSANADKMTWEINDSTNDNQGDYLLTVADNTKYDITLIAENAGSCADTLHKAVHVIAAGNQFPQVFSTSYASNFAPGAIVDNGEVLDFRIFEEKTGQEIFRSNGRKGWSGKDAKGNDVSEGIYAWMMIVDGKDATKVYKGKLNVQ